MSNQVAKREIDTVRSALNSKQMQDQLAHALPKHLTAERLARVVMTQVQNNPDLLKCSKQSLYAAVMSCAQVGLEPDGILGQAYLVPFKGRVQFIPGYKGLIALARNSGEVINIDAQAVHEKDEFYYEFGLNKDLKHIPARKDRGKVTHFYACASFKGGGNAFDVMSIEEVEAIRQASPGRNSPAWKNHFNQMGRKTLIRRLANYLPMNIQKAAAIEGAYESGKTINVNEGGDMVIDGETVEDPTPEQKTQGAKGAKSQLDESFGVADQQEIKWPKPDTEATITIQDGTVYSGTFGGVADGEFLINTDAGPVTATVNIVAKVEEG